MGFGWQGLCQPCARSGEPMAWLGRTTQAAALGGRGVTPSSKVTLSFLSTCTGATGLAGERGHGGSRGTPTPWHCSHPRETEGTGEGMQDPSPPSPSPRKGSAPPGKMTQTHVGETEAYVGINAWLIGELSPRGRGQPEPGGRQVPSWMADAHKSQRAQFCLGRGNK